MFPLGQLWSRRSGLGPLLAWTLGATALIFLLLQLWRPCFFLTDDNLSYWFPIYSEMSRRLHAGHSPFISDYLFGGGYNYLRDLNVIRWHPFMILPAYLLTETIFRFWIIDVSALCLLLLAAAGFVLLAWQMREEFALKIPDSYILFYSLSFVFTSYALQVGSSWIDFLGVESSLPWLALGLVERKLIRGTLLVLVFTQHEILCSFAPMIVSTVLCLTLFAGALAYARGTVRPLFAWLAGNLLACLTLSPLLLKILDGFGHSVRLQALPLSELRAFSIPAGNFLFSFFLGNWSELVGRWHGDVVSQTQVLPYLASILACVAAWCLLPSLLVAGPWRPLDKACGALAIALILFLIRPAWLAEIMHQLPFFRSMRLPFRESLQFLFFVHLLLVLRFPERSPHLQFGAAAFGVAMFLLPLPFIPSPTLNLLALDREMIFSGKAQRYWTLVKPLLKPSDETATAIDWPYWQANKQDIPYTLLGTANFGAYFRVRCVSAYAPTAPMDQVPLKTVPGYWFGAFREDQVPAILAERPDLRILRIVSTHPLEITMSTGSGPAIDLTPYLLASGIKEAGPALPTGH